jgi:hypothetical protein
LGEVSGLLHSVRNDGKHHKSDEDFPFAYGDTLVLQGFIGDSNALHTIPLIADTHVVFAFFPIVPLSTLFDTLKGEWIWYKKIGGIGGNTWNNEFKSVIKIISQNPDSSINYEVWVRDTVSFNYPNGDGYYIYKEIFTKDTLFYQGSLKIQDGWFSDKSAIIDLPHWNTSYLGEWDIYMENSPWRWRYEKPSKDTLVFAHMASDGYFYYYQKIK